MAVIIAKNTPAGPYTVGVPITSTVVVSNTGNTTSTTQAVSDPLIVNSTRSFTAVQIGGVTGFTASGTTAINDSVILPAGAVITYTITDTPTIAGTYQNFVSLNGGTSISGGPSFPINPSTSCNTTNLYTLVIQSGDGSGGRTNGYFGIMTSEGTFTYMGVATNSQYVYSVCSTTPPGGGWILGDPSVVSPGYVNGGNAVPTCTNCTQGTATECCNGGVNFPITVDPQPIPVQPLPFNVTDIDCDGNPVIDQVNMVVSIAGTKRPIPVCITNSAGRTDFQIGCSSVDDRIIILIVVTDINGVVTTSLVEQDGVTPVIDGSTLVNCGRDFANIQTCFQSQADPSIKYTRVSWFDSSNPTVIISTVWIDGTGIIVPAPANVEPCLLDEEYAEESVEFCAINDSPANYPNPGDPVGTAYNVGDRIISGILIEVHDLNTPVVMSYKNLSNQTYPLPFYLQKDGVDIIGTFPNPADFGDCSIDTHEVTVEQVCDTNFDIVSTVVPPDLYIHFNGVGGTNNVTTEVGSPTNEYFNNLFINPDFLANKILVNFTQTSPFSTVQFSFNDITNLVYDATFDYWAFTVLPNNSFVYSDGTHATTIYSPNGEGDIAIDAYSITTHIDGKPIELIKHFINGIFDSVEYRDLIGNPYTVNGVIGICKNIVDSTLDKFQIRDCAGNNIGPEQDVSKTVVLNKIQASICNVQELADAINAVTPIPPVLYNDVKQEETSLTPITIPANTVHSISYKITQGLVDITIGADTLTYQAGEADMEEATTFINQVYIFTPQVGGKVKIKTIK